MLETTLFHKLCQGLQLVKVSSAPGCKWTDGISSSGRDGVAAGQGRRGFFKGNGLGKGLWAGQGRKQAGLGGGGSEKA